MKKLEIYTKSRDKVSYSAKGLYEDGRVVVYKGSKIKLIVTDKFKASKEVLYKRNNRDLVNEYGILVQDVEFSSLSTAANFVTGRSSNGMITWKTYDKKLVRYSLYEENR